MSEYNKYLTLFESSPKKAYRYYLTTDHWQQVRRKTEKHYKGKCAKTGCLNNLDNAEMHTHHTNYRHLFNESIGYDTEYLCKGCHGAEHGFFSVPDKPIKLRKPKKKRKRKKKLTKEQQFKRALAKWKKKWR